MINLKNLNKKDLFNLFAYIAGIGIIFFLLFLAITSVWIGNNVKERCQIVQEQFDGDCIEALIQYLNDENNTFRDRNTAIWALGQLGDQRALPVLKSYYIGYEKGEFSNYYADISQYELYKAIKLIESGFNISAIFWR